MQSFKENPNTRSPHLSRGEVNNSNYLVNVIYAIPWYDLLVGYLILKLVDKIWDNRLYQG